MVKQILVVCNNETMREYLSGILVPNFNLVYRRSTQQALQWLNKGNLPDLILLDMEDKGPDYLAFVSNLRNRAVSDFPLVLLSEVRNYQQVLNCLQFGATDFITKPFFPEELLKKLNQVLRPQTNRIFARRIPAMRSSMVRYLS